MVEDIINLEKGKISIYKSATPWQNIRTIGEVIVETQLIIPSNYVIRPADIGAIIAGGVNKSDVYKRPMVEPGVKLGTGDIIESNSRAFSAQIKE